MRDNPKTSERRSGPSLQPGEGSGRLDHRRRAHDRGAGVLPEDAVRGSGEEFDADLSKAEASKRIDVLRAKTGRAAR
jgi:hypothetical protein